MVSGNLGKLDTILPPIRSVIQKSKLLIELGLLRDLVCNPQPRCMEYSMTCTTTGRNSVESTGVSPQQALMQ